MTRCPPLETPHHYSLPTWPHTYTELLFSVALRTAALVFQHTMIVEPHTWHLCIEQASHSSSGNSKGFASRALELRSSNKGHCLNNYTENWNDVCVYRVQSHSSSHSGIMHSISTRSRLLDPCHSTSQPWTMTSIRIQKDKGKARSRQARKVILVPSFLYNSRLLSIEKT